MDRHQGEFQQGSTQTDSRASRQISVADLVNDTTHDSLDRWAQSALAAGLHPDLAPWITYSSGYYRLFHPLLDAEMLLGDVEWINQVYQERLGECETAIKGGSWPEILACYEEDSRFYGLERILPWLSPSSFYRLLCDMIHKLGYLHEHEPWLSLCMRALAKCRVGDYIEGAALEILSTLPERVDVFRGISRSDASHVAGHSWTLDYRVAFEYARKHAKRGVVVHIAVPKGWIIGLCLGRGEQEAFLDPKIQPYLAAVASKISMVKAQRIPRPEIVAQQAAARTLAF